MHYPFSYMHSGVSVPAGGGDYIIMEQPSPASLSFYLGGSGNVDINWGEGTIQNVTLNASATQYTHAAGTTVTVSNPANVVYYYVLSKPQVTGISIPASAVNLYYIFITGTNITSLTTHPEWTALYAFGVSQNSSLSSLETHPEWVALHTFEIADTAISSIEMHPEWVNIVTIHCNGSNISTFTGYSTWTILDELSVYDTLISSITTYSTWTVFRRLLAHSNPNLTTVNVHPEFTIMYSLGLWGCPNLTTVTVYDTWVGMLLLTISNCALTETAVNNILITMDNVVGISSSAEIALHLGTNAAPTGAGLTAKASLQGKGVRVDTN